MRDEDELIEAARNHFVEGVALVAHEDEQVVRPVQYFDPKGCSAVQVQEDGTLHEGWWSPDRAFRTVERYRGH